MKAKDGLLVTITLATTVVLYIGGFHVFALVLAFISGFFLAMLLDDAGWLRSMRVTISRDDSGKWRVTAADGAA